MSIFPISRYLDHIAVFQNFKLVYKYFCRYFARFVGSKNFKVQEKNVLQTFRPFQNFQIFKVEKFLQTFCSSPDFQNFKLLQKNISPKIWLKKKIQSPKKKKKKKQFTLLIFFKYIKVAVISKK